jgi:hypothetical protein
MRWIPSFFMFTLAFCSAVSIVAAQSPGPAADAVSDKVQAGETFRSLDGRFTIGLPSQTSGFQGVSIETAGGPAKGDAYTWRLKTLSYTVLYVDIPPGGFSRSNPEETLDYITKSSAARLSDKGARITREKSVSVSNFPGREVKIDAGKLGPYLRSNLHRKEPDVSNDRHSSGESLRRNGGYGNPRPSTRSKLIADDEVDAIIRKQIADATPDPLPQEPPTAKPKSDAEDQELKGKVKSVVMEDEDKSGIWEVQGRKRSHLYEFNSAGNLTRDLMYDYKGNPADVTVYGYIDGARVSNSKFIQHEYNPPPPMMLPRELRVIPNAIRGT